MNTARSDARVLRGMAAQLELREGRLRAGEKPLGWKVGFGAPEAMARLGTAAPLVGFLTGAALLPSGAALSLAGWTKPVAEPEIAITLGADLPGSPDRETARAAIASLGPAIELADVSFPPQEVEAILAGNIYNRRVVLGRADASRAGCALEGVFCRVYRDGKEIAATAEPQALTGDLVEIVCHVAALLSAMGQRLRAGEVIITGSITPPLWIEADEEIRFTLDPIDTVAVRLRLPPGEGAQRS